MTKRTSNRRNSFLPERLQQTHGIQPAESLRFEVFPQCLNGGGGDFVDALLRHAELVSDFRIAVPAAVYLTASLLFGSRCRPENLPPDCADRESRSRPRFDSLARARLALRAVLRTVSPEHRVLRWSISVRLGRWAKSARHLRPGWKTSSDSSAGPFAARQRRANRASRRDGDRLSRNRRRGIPVPGSQRLIRLFSQNTPSDQRLSHRSCTRFHDRRPPGGLPWTWSLP